MGKLDQALKRKEKCVIYSQFVKMIRLIEMDLNKNNIAFLTLEGSLEHSKRSKVLK